MFVFTKANPVVRLRKKTTEAEEVLERLDSYLNAAEKKQTNLLVSLWNEQQNGITYKEIMSAIERGYMSEEALKAWQESYSEYVVENLKPLWTDAMIAANTALEALHPEYFFDPMGAGVQKWIAERGAAWVTVISDESRQAIQSMLMNSYSGEFTVDELARAIRPTIGLTTQQAKANLNYYNHIKTSLLKNNPGMKTATAEKRAQAKAAKYAAKQHMYRAQTIANTESAFAYNRGAQEGILQAQEQGLIGVVMKVWSTANDESVCTICADLDGQTIGVEDSYGISGKELFVGMHQTPPAHTGCRCAVMYVEEEFLAKPEGKLF